jgi:hypothetical protein
LSERAKAVKKVASCGRSFLSAFAPPGHRRLPLQSLPLLADSFIASMQKTIAQPALSGVQTLTGLSS